MFIPIKFILLKCMISNTLNLITEDQLPENISKITNIIYDDKR